ncbi:hypothetical protein AB1Y20_003936 [Prymnesium parvum]|uniref:Transglutaminase-like domain-containing protein n=1 Tax=Prymnesium parvum TaxID=97485 RepID=A0AB34J837_PRYPA
MSAAPPPQHHERRFHPRSIMMAALCLASPAAPATLWPPALMREYVLPLQALDESVSSDAAARQRLLLEATAIIGSRSAADARTVRQLNAALFPRLRVAYDPERTRAPNQPLDESLLRGAATCTGLSLLLVAALRANGVPARVAGTPAWHADDDPRCGNHNWVEAFVVRLAVAQWAYLGAAEDSPLDATWFTSRAARAPRGVFAARASGGAAHPLFPLAWGGGRVPAVERSARYRHAVRREVRLAAAAAARARGGPVCVVVREAARADEIAALVQFGARSCRRYWPQIGRAPLDGAGAVTLAVGEEYVVEAFVPCDEGACGEGGEGAGESEGVDELFCGRVACVGRIVVSVDASDAPIVIPSLE